MSLDRAFRGNWGELTTQTAETWPKPLSDEAYLAIVYNEMADLMDDLRSIITGEEPEDEEHPEEP